MRSKSRLPGRTTRRRGEAAGRFACQAALLAALVSALVACSADPPRNAIVVVVDGLRADRLSCYGNPVPTTPVIDSLAREGVLFEIAVSNAPSTLPAMVGLLTGDIPTQKLFSNGLQRSLVEAVRSAGFQTAAFVEGSFVSERNGLDRGFDTFRSQASRGEDQRGGAAAGIERTFAEALAWIRANRDQRFFVLIHTQELLVPLVRMDFAGGLDPGSLGETFETEEAAGIAAGDLSFGPVERTYVRALYDGGVHTADRHVGELLEVLGELGLREQTAIIVTSDHGQDLGGRDPERPGARGHHVYDELLLVPLVFFDPSRGYDVTRVTTQVRTIDTLPTLLDLLEIPAPEGGYGRSLLPVMHGDDTSPPGAWVRATSEDATRFVERHALRTQTHKLIMNFEVGKGFGVEVYDLLSDPGERADLSRTDQPLRMSLQRELLTVRRALAHAGLVRWYEAPESSYSR